MAVCDHCGQLIKNAHKEVLNKMKIKMLKRAAEQVITTNHNDFMVRDLKDHGEDFVLFNNFQKLRYHGLIAPIRNNGRKIKGRWLLTRNAWAFLRGELMLPSFVLVRDNHITERSNELLAIKHIRGEATIQTDFDYYDETTGARIPKQQLVSAPITQERLFSIYDRPQTTRQDS